MREKKCIICKNGQDTEVLYKENFDFKKLNDKTFSARRIPDGTHYRFLKCKKCGLIFSSPILEEKEISELYSKSTFNYVSESKYLQKTYVEYFKRHVFKDKFAQKKILEIGCGNGFFLEELEKIGAKNLFGVEPGRASVDKAKQSIKKNIKVAMFKKGLFAKESFDVVCCFHTFDHIVNPDIFLDAIFQLLRKNGKVFFVVHNTKGLSVKLLGRRSPIFDIEHIYLFNPSNLKRLFEMHGFQKVEVFGVKNIYQINYWLKLLPIPLFLKNFMYFLFKITGIGEIPISISAGNIGVVGTKLK